MIDNGFEQNSNLFKYQVGDVVTVRPDLSCDETYRMESGDWDEVKIGVKREMRDLAGMPVTIARHFAGRYRIIEDDMEHFWTDEMFV